MTARTVSAEGIELLPQRYQPEPGFCTVQARMGWRNFREPLWWTYRGYLPASLAKAEKVEALRMGHRESQRIMRQRHLVWPRVDRCALANHDVKTARSPRQLKMTPARRKKIEAARQDGYRVVLEVAPVVDEGLPPTVLWLKFDNGEFRVVTRLTAATVYQTMGAATNAMKHGYRQQRCSVRLKY